MRIPTKLILLIPDLRGGGAERAALGFAAGLSRDHFEVHLVVCDRTGELAARVPVDVAVHTLGRNALLAMPRAIYRFQRLTTALAPAAVISFLWLADAVQLLARGPRTPWKAIVSLHTVPQWLRYESIGLFKRALMSLVYARVDGVMAVSSRIESEFFELYPRAAGAVHWVQANPFPFKEIVAAGQAPTLPWAIVPGRRMVAVGRLDPVKGFDVLFEALALLPCDPPWQLMLVGDGSERPRLQALARKLGIDQRICFTGFQHNPYGYIGSADLLVVSSHSEAFPSVVIEARALGTAVISTDCPTGPAMMITDNVDGRLVPPGDPARLAAGIGELLADAPQRARYVAAARARIAAYDAPLAVAALEQQLLSLLAMP